MSADEDLPAAPTDSPRIGLALSGGGFRATAFGLGCLRALNDRELLPHIRVISGISGGSLLTAMWAYGPTEFAEFDASVVNMLRSSLQRELVKRTLTPAAITRNLTSSARALLTRQPLQHNRTDSLVAAIEARPFGRRFMNEVTHRDLATVISATDLSSGNAVRFGSKVSSCSAFGEITNPVTVAEAVGASAAYPALLPALCRNFEFRDGTGTLTPRTVVMTDGGVYDNLGLTPLLPGRSREHTHHVYDIDYIIAVDAGRGRGFMPKAARFWPLRMKQVFEITHTKSQDASRSRLHLAKEHGQISGFVHVYSGQDDAKLPIPPADLADLVRRDAVERYKTDFAEMPIAALNQISVRAEQLTRTLLAHYCPDLARR
jgi:predicted acylesterase/phospholipase RssA